MMNIIFFPFQIILKFFHIIEHGFYILRNFVWAYPDIFLEDNEIRTKISRIYKSGVPYSHFASSALMMIVLIVVLFFSGFPKIISQQKSILLEGVVMGLDGSGEIQQLSKINPILSSNIQLEKDLIELIYEPLLRFDYVPFEDGTKIGGVEFVLARDISTIIPGADYIFELRENVYWHDHNELLTERKFSSDDVISTFELISGLNIDIASSRALQQLQWERIDEHRVRVCTKLNEESTAPCSSSADKPIFSNFLELLNVKILPAHKIQDIDINTFDTLEPEIYRSPIGTGKYTFASAASDGITVRKNDNYHQGLLIDQHISEIQQIFNSNQPLQSIIETNELAEEIYDTYLLNDEINIQLASFNHYVEIGLAGDETNLLIDSLSIQDANPIENIKFVYFKDLPSAISSLKNAEIHSIASTSIEFRNDLRSFTQIQTNLSPVLYNQFWALYFNLRERPDGSAIGSEFLLNNNVRSAINQAINKDAIIIDSLKEVGSEAVGPVPDISYFFNSNAGWADFNRGSAETLLEKEGWILQEGDVVRTNDKGQILSFSLSFVENFDRRLVAESIQSDLAKVGIEVFIDRELETIPDFMRNMEIRQAIANHVFNHERIVSLRESGSDALSEISMASFLLEQGELYFDTAISPKEILFEQGWEVGSDTFRYKDNVRMQLSMNITDTEEQKSIAESFKLVLGELGIELHITFTNNDFDISTWSLQELNDQLLAPRLFDTILYGMDRFIDPEMFELYHSSQSSDPGLNISSYSSDEITVDKRTDRKEGESSLVQVPKVDKFLEQARSFDPINSRVERKEKYDDIQRVLANEVPVIYLYHPQFLYFSNNIVQSISLDGAKSIEERFRNIEFWSV